LNKEDHKERVTWQPLLNIGPQDIEKLELAAYEAYLQEDIEHFAEVNILFPLV
jgi:hypothetical protein